MTLMELMIVVVIVSILASIAIPSYIQQVRKSRRVEAKTALLDLAGREERYFSTSVTGANYSALPADLGYTGAWPIQVGNNYYQVTLCVATVAGTTPACDPNPNAPTAPSFYIRADPVAGTSQASDAAVHVLRRGLDRRPVCGRQPDRPVLLGKLAAESSGYGPNPDVSCC